jgi:O-antigen ligase
VGIQLSFFLAFLIGFLVSVERQGAKLLMEGLAISGVVYATIALGLISYDFSGVLWGDRPGTLDSLAFPFPNRNHAATFYGSCSLLCLSQLMGVLLPLRGRTMRLSDLYWETLSSNPWQAALWAVGLLICLTATFLTKSRAGTLLSLLMLISCAGFYAFRFAGRQPLRLMFTGAAAFLGVVFVELWGSGGLASRIAALGLWDAERLAVYRSTINMILDHPWIGTGLGTFVLAFPAYRSPDIGSTLVWDKAHNTLLEIAAEQGLPFSICLIVVSSYVALRLIRCVVRGQSLKYVTPAFFVGSLGVLHSLVDFPLQNVGFSTFFAAIIGCGYSRCAQRRESFSSSVAMATSQAVNGS